MAAAFRTGGFALTLKTAILGGTSHIARAITPYLLEAGAELTLFARSPEKLPSGPWKVKTDFALLSKDSFDLVINCIGAGTPKELASDYNRWFSVLERFDNLALDYLKNVNPAALYVMFSSGAVYGRRSGHPAAEDTSWEFFPNRIKIPDYYAISKIYSEAKHRSLPHLRIADLRIFSFFSRHIVLDSGYFMTDLVTALLNKRTFSTSPVNIIRDFPHPADLVRLILRCAAEPEINTAIDAASKQGISKTEILHAFAENFGLNYNITELSGGLSPNGSSDVYLPTVEMAEKKLDWKAEVTSLETLLSETKVIWDNYGKA